MSWQILWFITIITNSHTFPCTLTTPPHSLGCLSLSIRVGENGSVLVKHQRPIQVKYFLINLPILKPAVLCHCFAFSIGREYRDYIKWLVTCNLILPVISSDSTFLQLFLIFTCESVGSHHCTWQPIFCYQNLHDKPAEWWHFQLLWWVNRRLVKMYYNNSNVQIIENSLQFASEIHRWHFWSRHWSNNRWVWGHFHKMYCFPLPSLSWSWVSQLGKKLKKTGPRDKVKLGCLVNSVKGEVPRISCFQLSINCSLIQSR